ncbi:MAG TPA: SUKH-4 family immunity protein [Streptomyces sp.]|nr:SUKH-4 family immunity protein [Streptomyces sp.]
MGYAVTEGELIRLYGTTGVVYFPRHPESGLDPRTATFLSSTGIPHDETFVSRFDVEEPGHDTANLGERFDRRGRRCPEEARSWLLLGYLTYSLVALDPASGKVYVFPEGDDSYTQLHRDVESLVFTLAEFRKLEEACLGTEDPEEPVTGFRARVDSFDPIPLAGEGSEWNRILDEVLSGMWG